MQIACVFHVSDSMPFDILFFLLRHYSKNLINCGRFYYFEAVFEFIDHFDFADCLQTQSNQKLRSICLSQMSAAIIIETMAFIL